MKFNKKVSIVDAFKLQYNKESIDELKKFIPMAVVGCDKAGYEISTYKGFSPTKTTLFGKENDWLIKEENGDLKILEEKEFLEKYESVVE